MVIDAYFAVAGVPLDSVRDLLVRWRIWCR
jgi:hypothetical protein